MAGNQKGNIHEPIDSATKSSSSICCHVGLRRSFAENASGQPATRRGLSQLHYCGGGARPSGSHLGRGNTAIGTFRCLASPLAASIPLLALDRLILTPRIQIRSLALQRFLFNTTGTENTANGTAALEFNTTGDFNTANGAFALFSNTEGANNTAVGASALFSNTTGEFNNAVGFNALRSNVDGLFNNVMGFDAMADNVSGAGNVAIGDSVGAGVDGDFNNYIGAFAGPASGSESETTPHRRRV